MRHHVAELPEIRPEVVEYRLHRLTCPSCGAANRAKLPADVPRDAFGPRLQPRAGLLSGAHRLSERQVQRQAGAVLADPMAEIVEAVRRAGAVHVDEAGRREGGEKAWLRVGATAGAWSIARGGPMPCGPCWARTPAATGW